MTIEIECRQCGRPFVPTLQEMKRGPQYYRFCSDACRNEAEADAAAA
jgi:endogenous inhibitor of DNA gyrase (YacG/DUF329 family)